MGKLSESSGRNLRIVAPRPRTWNKWPVTANSWRALLSAERDPDGDSVSARPAEESPFWWTFPTRRQRAPGRTVPAFSPEVLVRMGACSWTGNVRQLGITVDRLVSAAKDRAVDHQRSAASLRTDVSELGPSWSTCPNGIDLRLLLAQLEERLIDQALHGPAATRIVQLSCWE